MCIKRLIKGVTEAQIPYTFATYHIQRRESTAVFSGKRHSSYMAILKIPRTQHGKTQQRNIPPRQWSIHQENPMAQRFAAHIPQIQPFQGIAEADTAEAIAFSHSCSHLITVARLGLYGVQR
jgi:hypothetical protein